MTYWVGAVGSLLFVLVLLLDGATRPGYSSVRHPVSALALGPRGWIQTSNFLLCGAAITAGAIGIVTGSQHLLLGMTLALFGLAVIASGMFRMDPMRGYPPGAPEGDPTDVSVSHRLHDHAGAVVFMSLPIAAAVAAFVMPGLGWKGLAVVAALGLTISSGAFARAWERESSKTGLIQRSYIVPGWLWVAVVFLHFA